MIDLHAKMRSLVPKWTEDMLNTLHRQGPIISRTYGGVQEFAPHGESYGWKGAWNTNDYGIAEALRLDVHRYDNDELMDWLCRHVVLNVRNWWLYFKAKGRGPNEGVHYKTMPKSSRLPAWVYAAVDESGIPLHEMLTSNDDDNFILPDADRWDGSSYERHRCYAGIMKLRADGRFQDAMERNGLTKWLFRLDAMLERFVGDYLQGSDDLGYGWKKAGNRHHWGHYPIMDLLAYYQMARDVYRPMVDAAYARLHDPKVDYHLQAEMDNSGFLVSNPDWRRWELAKKALRTAEAMVWWCIGRGGPGSPVPVEARNGDTLWTWDNGHPGWSYKILGSSWPQYLAYGWPEPEHVSRAWYDWLRAQAYAECALEPHFNQRAVTEIRSYLKQRAKWYSLDPEALPPMDMKQAGDQLACAGTGQGGMKPDGLPHRFVTPGRPGMSAEEWAALPDDAKIHPVTVMFYDHSFGDQFGPSSRYTGRPIWTNQAKMDATGRGNWAGVGDLIWLAGIVTGDEEMQVQGDRYSVEYIDYFHKNGDSSSLIVTKGDRWTDHYATNRARAYYWLRRVGHMRLLLTEPREDWSRGDAMDIVEG